MQIVKDKSVVVGKLHKSQIDGRRIPASFAAVILIVCASVFVVAGFVWEEPSFHWPAVFIVGLGVIIALTGYFEPLCVETAGVRRKKRFVSWDDLVVTMVQNMPLENNSHPYWLVLSEGKLKYKTRKKQTIFRLAVTDENLSLVLNFYKKKVETTDMGYRPVNCTEFRQDPNGLIARHNAILAGEIPGELSFGKNYTAVYAPTPLYPLEVILSSITLVCASRISIEAFFVVLLVVTLIRLCLANVSNNKEIKFTHDGVKQKEHFASWQKVEIYLVPKGKARGGKSKYTMYFCKQPLEKSASIKKQSFAQMPLLANYFVILDERYKKKLHVLDRKLEQTEALFCEEGLALMVQEHNNMFSC